VIDRRACIGGVALGWVAAPRVAAAQRSGRVVRVGIAASAAPLSELVGPEPANPAARGFVQGLRALGYVEGQNLILDRRSAEGRPERFGAIVAELVALEPDVILTGNDRMTRAAKAVTSTVPIVMAISADPVGTGIVRSLARPGGNVTGLTAQAGPEIEAKRLELLKAMLPGASRIAVLVSKEDGGWERPLVRSVRTAAQTLGVTLVLAESSLRQHGDAFARISHARPDALFVAPGGVTYVDRAVIVDFATRTRLPSSFDFREAVEIGGLMSYGVNLADNYRRAAGYVGKILKGAKPADLPVEQPTKFELVVNLKTAKALGITIPQTLLLRADEMIE
jgi:putative ABC transport system substrate-binding protein